MEDVRDRRRRINRARRTLREFLDQIHVLDILVDRTSVLTVDVGLKMHAILSATLEYHHHQASAWTPPENRSNDPQLASQAVAQQITPGVGSPGSWLPSDVLSEVGVFDASKAAQAARDRDRQRQDPDPNQSAALAGGSSAVSVVEDQSLCRLIQPLTFKEVAAYLRDLTRETAEASLDKWREENFNLLCGPSRARPSRTSERSKIVPENSKKKTVMYHVDGRTPPRPMLCVDDRDATVLRAIELLLTYPDLNALPIVNPSTATVVAHVTLGQLLAYTAIQTRDPAMSALAEIEVTARTTGGNLVYRYLGEKQSSIGSTTVVQEGAVVDQGGNDMDGTNSQSTNASLYRGNSGTGTEEKDEQTNRGVSNRWRTAVVRDGFLSAASSFSSTKPNAGSNAAIVPGAGEATDESGRSNSGETTATASAANTNPGSTEQESTASPGDGSSTPSTTALNSPENSNKKAETSATTDTSSAADVAPGALNTSSSAAATGSLSSSDPSVTTITVVREEQPLAHVLTAFMEDDYAGIPVIESAGHSRTATADVEGSEPPAAECTDGSREPTATAASSAASAPSEAAGTSDRTKAASSTTAPPNTSSASSTPAPTENAWRGTLTRRQILQYLDLCCQDALDVNMAPTNVGTFKDPITGQLSSYPMSLKPERLLFDVDTSVGKVLDILYEAEMKKVTTSSSSVKVVVEREGGGLLDQQHPAEAAGPGTVVPGESSQPTTNRGNYAQNTLPGNRLMPGCTVITKPVASMREAMPLVLGDRATRVVFLDPRDRLLTRIFTAGDALALLLYDQ